MLIEISDQLRKSLERLEAAAGYEDGLEDMLLETCIPDGLIIDCVAISLTRFCELSPDQIAAVGRAALEERLRISRHDFDRWVAKNTLKLEVPER